jgi:hypothetical protein
MDEDNIKLIISHYNKHIDDKPVTSIANSQYLILVNGLQSYSSNMKET